jgi:hypothetical protein
MYKPQRLTRKRKKYSQLRVEPSIHLVYLDSYFLFIFGFLFFVKLLPTTFNKPTSPTSKSYHLASAVTSK